VEAQPLSLVEFPADDVERARTFWEGLLAIELEARREGEGQGRQTHSDGTQIGIHARGPGPGDTWSLPYFAVSDIDAALARVSELGGSVIHPGETSAVCRDSEGTPFGLLVQVAAD
jgi:predicted enzyme related to lactoylglutathione lyase